MFIAKNNSRSKDEVYETKLSNMIHSTLKTWFFFGDSSVSKESTSQKLYNRLKKQFQHTEVIWWRPTKFHIFQTEYNFLGIFKQVNAVFADGYCRLDLWYFIPFVAQRITMYRGTSWWFFKPFSFTVLVARNANLNLNPFND